jgi:hypothetical protein
VLPPSDESKQEARIQTLECMFGELQGQAHKDVLLVFRGAYHEAGRGNNDALTIERKIRSTWLLF